MQRVAPGVAPQPLGGAGGAQRTADGGGELGELRGLETLEAHPADRPPRGREALPPGVGRGRFARAGPAPGDPHAGQHEDPVVAQPPQREHQHPHRGRVGPLQVVEHQQHRVLARHRAQRTEQVGAHGQRVGPRVAVGAQQREAVQQGRREVRQELVEQPVREPGLRGVAGGGQDGGRPAPGDGAGEDRALAGARLALHPHDARPPGARVVPGLVDERQRSAAPDEHGSRRARRGHGASGCAVMRAT